jgi:Mn2+/Fe2+ NRAMP family transporter
LALNFVRIDPIRALFWAAVINGVTAVPIMVVTMLLASNRKVMGKFGIPVTLKIIGWIATAVMLLASIGLFATLKG